MLFSNSTKKVGAVLCVAALLLVTAQTVISNTNQNPIAIAGDDIFVDIGVTVGFDGSMSYDPDDMPSLNQSVEQPSEPEPLNYTWNFQDGMEYGAIQSHAFDTAGKYLVILMVKDSQGGVGFDTLNVTVMNSPPVAFIEVNETAYEDEVLEFNATQSTDNTTDIPSLEYLWDFGDGTTSNESVVNHTYTRSGTYIPSLKVIDNDGAMDIEFTKIEVTNLPPVSGKMRNRTVLEDQIVTFSPAVFDTISDQQLLKYQWNFGDGMATEGMIVEHVYTKSGTYEVTLTATDDDGAQCSDSFFVFVENSDPQLEIKNVTETIYEGRTYVFESVGNDTSGDHPLLNYTQDNGRFGWRTTNLWEDDWTGDISCQVVDDDGSVSSASKTVTVENTDPTVSVVDAYLIANITLRAAGEKFHDAELYLNESGVPREELWVLRNVSDPKDQEATAENVKLTLSETWQAEVRYTPLTDPVNGNTNGATPVWIIIEFDNGVTRKIPHTFNAVQPSTWYWNVTLNDFFFSPNDNPTMHFEYWVFDAGRDSETVTWDFGEATMTQSFGASTFPTEIVSTIDYTPINLTDITVTVVDDDGGSGTDNLYFINKILDNIAPKAYASGDTTGIEDTAAYFSGSGTDSVSDSGNLNYNWMLGDGATLSGSSAQYIFEDEGKYMIILEVTDGTDSTYDAYFIDISNAAPIAVPDMENNVVYEDDVVRFNGSLSSDTLSDMDSLLYSWSFSGLVNRPEIVVEHTFSFAGSYDVDLTVLDDNGACGTDTISIDVENVIPSALVEENITVNEDQAAFLSCVGIDTISDRPLLDYNWTFGYSYDVTIVNMTTITTVVVVNGTNVTQTNITYNNETYTVTPYGLGWNPVFVYNQSGNYYPEVNVTDDDGAYSHVAGNITVVNVPPVAFAGNDMKIFAGITNISFNATGIDTYSDIGTLEYYWDFGNGNYSDEQNAIYAYTQDGNYTVNLTVVDDDGAVAVHSINVTVRIDSDGDGMPDVWEILHGLDHLDPTGDNGAEGDPDEDYLVNLQEYYYGLHPLDDDTDDDGILDGVEDANTNGIVDAGETDPLNYDTDDDGLNDGLEIGLNVAQGDDTAAFWQNDWDSANVTDPLDADTDDDGITDGNEDVNHNGLRDGSESAAEIWDTDNDYLSDGLEIGLTVPQHADTDINLFRADTDPTTTTLADDPDCDDDGLLDGVEDINHNGFRDSNEPDPNDWDSEDDGLADGSGNTVNVLTLTEVFNAAEETKSIAIWVNGTTLPHIGYAVPDTGTWEIAAESTVVMDETISVAFFLNELPLTIYSGPLEESYVWIPDATGSISINMGVNLILNFTNEEVNYAFADPDPAITDADGDGMDDFAEALYLSGRVRDFRTEDSDGDLVSRTLLDGTTIYNNLIDADSDNDGLSDGDEWLFGSDMLKADTDGDQIGDAEEFLEGTNPIDWDTDWDGLTDYEELRFADDNIKTNATNNDTDGDGLLDGWDDLNHNLEFDAGDEWGETGDLAQPIHGESRNEGGYGTNATRPDTDYDGLNDGDELTFLWEPVWDVTHADSHLTDISWNSDPDDDNLYNLIDPDSDNDGILDGPEKLMWESYSNITYPGWDQNSDDYDYWDRKINIIDDDSDNEGLEDGKEMLIYGTRADEWDTDSDGKWSYYANYWRHKDEFNDCIEVGYWLGVGKTEAEAGANACNNDTDSDGMWDGWEYYHGLNPGVSTGDDGPDGDPDHDGLTNIQEYIPDGINIRYNLEPTDGDTDDDGLKDGFNDVNEDGIWNDLNANGLWDSGEEAWGEIGDPDNSNDGGYGTYAYKKDSDNDRFINTYVPSPNSAFTTDAAEVNYWLAKNHRSEARNYNSAEAGAMARNRDVDGDGINDGFEVLFSTMSTNQKQQNSIMANVVVLDPDDPNDAANDPDQDGLSSWEEYVGWDVRIDFGSGEIYHVWSNPHVNNWDNDGLDDGEERDYATSITNDPCAGYGTDPRVDDTDSDGIKDGAWNEPHALDPDSDDDGLGDKREYDMAPGEVVCSQTMPDSDGDGLWDGWHDTDKDAEYDTSEIKGELGEGATHWGGFNTRPVYSDTDGDGFYDGWVDNNANTIFDAGDDWGEIGDPSNSFIGGYGCDANDADTDGDGLTDMYEQITLDSGENHAPLDSDGDEIDNLHDPDSDDDGLYDGWDDTNGNQAFDDGVDNWGEVGDPANSYAGGYRSYSRNDDSDDDNFKDGEEAQYWDGISSTAWNHQYDGGTEISNLRDPNADSDSWLDGNEVNTQFTLPYDEDCDNDGVIDSLDVDPWYDVGIYVKITEIRAQDQVDGGGSGADFYVKVLVSDAISSTYSGVGITDDDDTPSSWDNDHHRTPNEIGDWFKFYFDITDRKDWGTDVSISIHLFDDDGDGERDDRCDISKSNSGPDGNKGSDPWDPAGDNGRNCDLTYDMLTGTWTGDDEAGDSNGLGHVSGEEDGSTGPNELTGDHEDDCELWFDIWQDGDDGDGLTYWEETNLCSSDPTDIRSPGWVGYFMKNELYYILRDESPDINSYSQKMGEYANLGTKVITGDWATAETLKEDIIQYYHNGMVGAVLVGDMPMAFDDSGLNLMSLFYEDMDGTWDDSDGDGLYEIPADINQARGNAPEIFVGLLRPPTSKNDLSGMANYLVNYFSRANDYLSGNWLDNDRSLLFEEITFNLDAIDVYNSLELHYLPFAGEGQVFSDKSTYIRGPTIDDAIDLLRNRYEYGVLMGHSDYNQLYFPSDGTIESHNIALNSSGVTFNILPCCSTTEFMDHTNTDKTYPHDGTDYYYIAGYFSFDEYGMGLGTFGYSGSAFGGLPGSEGLFNSLNQGITIGDSILAWGNSWKNNPLGTYSLPGNVGTGYNLEHYYMNYIGDPLLKT